MEAYKDADDNHEDLSSEEETSYRAAVARANFMCQDRSDTQFAVNEHSRSMSSPKTGDMMRLKKLARYLVGRSRHQLRYDYQNLPGEQIKITAHTDTDFAGFDEVHFILSEDLIITDSLMMILEVKPVNDPPFWRKLDDI